jgi:glycosyltransferase involved in cell wall biosynthesis
LDGTQAENCVTNFTLVSGDFVTTGGMDRANFAIADYLSRSGRKVTLVTHRVDDSLRNRPHLTIRIVPKLLGSHLIGSWPLAWAGKQASGQNGRVVVNGGNCCVADVNWVHYLHAAYQPTSANGLLRKLKAAVERPLNLRAERLALGMARTVICNSEQTRRAVIERIGVAPERAVTVYYGTDATRFHPPSTQERADLRQQLGWHDTAPVVVFIGALGDRRKGFDTLFSAWVELCRKPDWDAVLVVIGSGAELPAWEERTRSAGLADRIRYLGFRSDVPNLLRAADMLVAPTRYEAYGLGVHEAICCGLPAIVSANAGIAERYPPELADFLLTSPEDSAELATKLSRWRTSTTQTREKFAGFSAHLRSRSWDDMAREFLTVIGESAS